MTHTTERTSTMDTITTGTAAIDNLTWDDWSPAQVCALESGDDCTACEG